MKTYQIKHRNGSIITEGKAKSLGDFVVKSVKAGVDLRYADLSGIDLCYADLRGAWLHGANLSNADLRGANLTDVKYNKYTKGFNFDLYFELRSRGIGSDAAVSMVTL